MNKIETFQQFLETQGIEISIWVFIFNLALSGILGYILSVVYVKYGMTLSNRKMFAKNFIIMAMTTMFIITIVKSSLALSLGLVGALSIVRFRAAIKEPEELSYLFLTIAIGLGLGADQILITVVAFAVIVFIIWLRNFTNKRDNVQNLHLTVSSQATGSVKLDNIVEILDKNCTGVNLKRYDESSEMIEASFVVEFDSVNNLNDLKSGLQEISNDVKITFLDTKSLMSY